MKHHFHEVSWHKLDNAANIFPLISNKNYSNVFRVSVELKEIIEPELLQIAIDKTLPWFENFQFRIRRGFFWNYFEKNKAQLLVEEEKTRPCLYIEASKNHHYLFKVMYYKKRITLEVFHAITDGMGAMSFLKALVINYLKIRNSENVIVEETSVEVVSDTEDSYRRHYKKRRTTGDKPKQAFRIKGKRLPMYTMKVIHGYLEVDQLSNYCKSKGMTMTVYLAAVYIWSIYQAYSNEGLQNKPINVAVPVNLRRFFDSTTGMNFFAHITASMIFSEDEYDFEEVVTKVKEQFDIQVTKENFSKIITENVALRRKIITRALPLLLKYIMVKWIYLSSMKAYTTTLSNLGKIDIQQPYSDAIEHFEFLLNPTIKDPVKCGVCTKDNRLVITLTSQLENTYIQKEFFRKIAQDGLSVIVESNGDAYENL